jgi:hypothetical protein
MFDDIRRTVQKRTRLKIRYRSPDGQQVDYVDKFLHEAIPEYRRLVQAIQDLRLVGRSVPRCRNHPALEVALFALDQVEPETEFAKPVDLARELGRLNGCLHDTIMVLERLKGSRTPQLETLRFYALFWQTARKRDLSRGWNRSAIDKPNQKEIVIDAEDTDLEPGTV